MNLNDAMNDLGSMNTLQHFVMETWSELGNGLTDLVSHWQSADHELRGQFLEYNSKVNPAIVKNDDLITVRVRHGSATFRLNDPFGHVSVVFTRETSFGLSNLLELYSITFDEHGNNQLVRIDDQDISPSSLEDLLNATRLNLLQPKVSPARVGAAMAAMNASATTH